MSRGSKVATVRAQRGGEKLCGCGTDILFSMQFRPAEL